MARIFLYIVAGLIVLVVVGAILIAAFGTQMFQWAVTPSGDFDSYEVSPAPDYSDPANWVALPDKQDSADVTPGDLNDSQASAQADVFFIHPTTYISNDRWNAPLDDETARQRIDLFVMQYQASAFNGCCRIYAPLYRQATLGAFYDYGRESGEQALALAYDDVRRAFRHYLATQNEGRPFILASHSQGSRHLILLLEDEIDGRDVEGQLIAAYVIGYPVPLDVFGRKYASLQPCKEAGQTGCVISWNSFGDGGNISGLRSDIGLPYNGTFETGDGKDILCTNPLSWTTDEEAVPASENPGGAPLALNTEPPGPPDPNVTGAQCRDGVLYVEPTVEDGYDEIVTPGRNYHVYDYNLFYVPIRENAIRRVEAFLSGSP
ncbi:MAG: DUF3089 domain-containing protein [Alphaproteobacteria bacterium]